MWWDNWSAWTLFIVGYAVVWVGMVSAGITALFIYLNVIY